MKRLFHSLKFRILMPVLLMALGITLVLTIVISEAYTSTILSQEEEKTQASFSIIGGAMDAALHNAQSAATLTMMNTDIMHYALRSYRTDVEMVHSRQNCINIFSTTISQQPYLYGLLVMRSDGSMFGVLPYRNYFITFTYPRADAPSCKFLSVAGWSRECSAGWWRCLNVLAFPAQRGRRRRRKASLSRRCA